MARDATNEVEFDMEAYKHELDKILAPVMPSHHPVHERLTEE